MASASVRLPVQAVKLVDLNQQGAEFCVTPKRAAHKVAARLRAVEVVRKVLRQGSLRHQPVGLPRQAVTARAEAKCLAMRWLAVPFRPVQAHRRQVHRLEQLAAWPTVANRFRAARITEGEIKRSPWFRL